jgi:hypothetical protein
VDSKEQQNESNADEDPETPSPTKREMNTKIEGILEQIHSLQRGRN